MIKDTDAQYLKVDLRWKGNSDGRRRKISSNLDINRSPGGRDSGASVSCWFCSSITQECSCNNCWNSNEEESRSVGVTSIGVMFRIIDNFRASWARSVSTEKVRTFATL
jgi:hypothetical protein